MKDGTVVTAKFRSHPVQAYSRLYAVILTLALCARVRPTGIIYVQVNSRCVGLYVGHSTACCRSHTGAYDASDVTNLFRGATHRTPSMSFTGVNADISASNVPAKL